MSPRPATLAALVLAAVVGLLAGCTDDPGPDPAARAGGGGEGAAQELRTRVRLIEVAGELGADRRRALARAAGDVVEGYVTPAFLAASPGEDPEGAFDAFTPGARQLARQDARVLTSAAFGAADEVRAGRATVDVTAVAPEGVAVGATARVRVRFTLGEDDTTRRATLRGRLLLTPGDGGWQVFGYDLALGGAAVRASDR